MKIAKNIFERVPIDTWNEGKILCFEKISKKLRPSKMSQVKFKKIQAML